MSFDNNVARLQLGSDLRVIGTAARPGLSGRATIREGGHLFLGRNIYTIDGGTIDFTRPDAIEPHLTLAAHTRAGGEDIALTVKGPPDRLQSDLRSATSPELGQADVASLLLTGRRLDQISADAAQVVGEQAFGYISGDVLALTSQVIGLDSIRLVKVSRTARIVLHQRTNANSCHLRGKPWKQD